MGFVGLRTTLEEDRDIDELETMLRRIGPLKVESRTDAIKQALRIAAWYLKTGPFFPGDCLTGKEKPEKHGPERRPKSIIYGQDIGLDGKPTKKPTPLL